MNRWLMPCLVIGLVSAITLSTFALSAFTLSTFTLSTLSPLVAQPQTTTQGVEPPIRTQKRPLPTAVKPIVALPTPLCAAGRPTYSSAPTACYATAPSIGKLPPPHQVGGTMAPDAMPQTPGTRQPAVTHHAMTIADLINHQRAQVGLMPLTLVPALTQAAYRHSVDMGEQVTPTHQGTDGSSGGERMLAAGYLWQGWAEVIGWGFTEPTSVVEWWLNHAEHRAILLSPAFTEFGVGYVALDNTPWQSYWTINFGRPLQHRALTESGAPVLPLTQEAPPPLYVTPEPIVAQSEMSRPNSGSIDGCPVTSSQTYTLIPMTGIDLSHPAPIHADLNLAQRGYEAVPGQANFTDLTGPIDDDAPQLAQLFTADQPIHFTKLYQVYDWDWHCGDHGCRSEPLTAPEATMIGLQTEPGAPLRSPARQASIYHDDSGEAYVAAVLYAEANRLTLAYTRDGSVAQGYVVHLEQICVDPMLVQRYTAADRDGRQQLPALRHNQRFGVAQGQEVRLAIRDRGAFLDPRSRKDWWQGF